MHETTIHSLSLPWYLSTVFTSTPAEQLQLALVVSPWLLPRPAAPPLPLTAWSSLTASAQIVRLKELLVHVLWLSCSSFSRMRFCCCLSGVMTPISPPSNPSCSTNYVCIRKDENINFGGEIGGIKKTQSVNILEFQTCFYYFPINFSRSWTVCNKKKQHYPLKYMWHASQP